MRNLLLVAAYLTLGSLGFAQPFSSGSNGSDGALFIPSGLGEVLFDPSAYAPPLDADGDGIYHFTTITVSQGSFLKLTSARMGSGPVHWLAQGQVVINGYIRLSGENGKFDSKLNTETFSVMPAMGGPGGFPGGFSNYSPTGGIVSVAGQGPGGGAIGAVVSGSHATRGLNAIGDTIYGNSAIMPLIGGSGGGGFGGFFQETNPPRTFVRLHGGGGGGGALLLASSVSISGTGYIESLGGQNDRNSENRMAGSGGAVRCVAPVISGSFSVDVRGGQAVLSNGTPVGQSGGNGRIRFEASQYLNTGTHEGVVRVAPLQASTILFPDQNLPLRLTSVAGVPIPVSPTGSQNLPDVVTSPSQSLLPFVVAGTGIPPNSSVSLFIATENDQITTASSVLLGSFEQTSATIWSSLPAGTSSVYLKSNWAP